MAQARIIELNESNTCKICDNALAKYSCPRCNILYCSLLCYQHQLHLECSEDFYKDSVVQELGLNDQRDALKMEEILKRVHENNKLDLDAEEESEDDDKESDLDSDDNPDIDDITQRLEGINLDNAEQVWEVLTEDEKQEFVAFLRSEDVTKLIPAWEPWWLFHNDKKVQDVEDKTWEEHKKNCPEIKEIKPFKELTKKEPSSSVQYNLMNILSSYVFTVRYFNGEHFDFPQEATSCWASLALTIKTKENFQDGDMAIKSVEQQCLNSDWILTDEENINVMKEDLNKILTGPNLVEKKYYIKSALSDLWKLLDTSLNWNPKPDEFTKKFPQDHFPSVKMETKDSTEAYLKKIDYYLSFVEDLYP